VTNDEILERAELIFSSGIENLKLYYMIGLPSETDEDLVAIRDLTLQLREIMLPRQSPRPRRPHRRQREPAGAQARHRLPVAADGAGDVIERKMKRLRALVSASTTSTSTSRASGTRIPGAAVARRPARAPAIEPPSATAATGAAR
jgi:hypothetical protein